MGSLTRSTRSAGAGDARTNGAIGDSELAGPRPITCALRSPQGRPGASRGRPDHAFETQHPGLPRARRPRALPARRRWLVLGLGPGSRHVDMARTGRRPPSRPSPRHRRDTLWDRSHGVSPSVRMRRLVGAACGRGAAGRGNPACPAEHPGAREGAKMRIRRIVRAGVYAEGAFYGFRGARIAPIVAPGARPGPSPRSGCASDVTLGGPGQGPGRRGRRSGRLFGALGPRNCPIRPSPACCGGGMPDPPTGHTPRDAPDCNTDVVERTPSRIWGRLRPLRAPTLGRRPARPGTRMPSRWPGACSPLGSRRGPWSPSPIAGRRRP